MTQALQQLFLPAGDSVATQRIQSAIDLAKHGPVEITLGDGEHLCGGLWLRSNVTLRVSAGAVLRFLPDYESYADTEVDVAAEQSNRAMIAAQGAENICLEGDGRIICDGAAKFSVGDDAVMGTRIPASLRPRVLVLDGCRNVTMRDLTVLDSPMWTLHFVDCEQVTISDLKVQNDMRMPNTDGIVLDGCRGVKIAGCQISTADDGIVLKTSAREGGGTTGPCLDIHVSDCRVASRSCAFKIGTESFAPFADIVFEDCVIENSNRAMGIFSRDGGGVQRVRFQRISLVCDETPSGYWGSGEPITINALARRPHISPAGAIRDIAFLDITGQVAGAINLSAEQPGQISQVRIAQVDLTQVAGPYGTALCYDLRPTPADLEPSEDAAGRINAWRIGPDGRVIGLADYPGGLPGLFAHRIAALDIGDVSIRRPDPLPKGWAANPFTILEDVS